VHSDHNIFIQGIEQKKKLRLTFFSREHFRKLLRQCAPLYYSKRQIEGDGLDSYYLWDFEATKGSRFLALPSSQIVTMELTEDTFNMEDFSSHEEMKVNSTKGPGV
jgi:hypothetical protein